MYLLLNIAADAIQHNGCWSHESLESFEIFVHYNTTKTSLFSLLTKLPQNFGIPNARIISVSSYI